MKLTTGCQQADGPCTAPTMCTLGVYGNKRASSWQQRDTLRIRYRTWMKMYLRTRSIGSALNDFAGGDNRWCVQGMLKSLIADIKTVMKDWGSAHRAAGSKREGVVRWRLGNEWMRKSPTRTALLFGHKAARTDVLV
jgi:hypothetical protein